MNPQLFDRISAGLCTTMLALVWSGAAGAQPPTKPDENLFGEAILKTWVRPHYPPQAVKAKLEGRVIVRFMVDENGVVTDARAMGQPDPRLVDAALAAVRQWTFEPALEKGKPAPICMEGPVVFQLADLKRNEVGIMASANRPHALPKTPVAGKVQITPDYPEELLERKLPGRVRVRYVVNAAGRVEAPAVVVATHPAFVLPTLAAMEQWEFTPSQQGDRILKTNEDSIVEFSVWKVKQRAEILAANGLSLAPTEETAVAVAATPGDPAPLPDLAVVIEPVHPYDLLVAGTDGEATVDFTVNPSGAVESLVVRAASRPEFGQMLAVAAQGWRFYSQPASVRLTLHRGFSLPTTGGGARLLAILREQQPADFGGRGLDAPLRPVYTIVPPYPNELRTEHAPGAAVVEFFVDADGRVRLPHVVSATREEFGRVAVTAVAQWVFRPPRRDGRPADVRVQLPFDFAAPP